MQEQGAAARNGALRRAQWLRAAILGANDGLLSTTSLILGIGAAKEDRRSMVLSGMAGAIAGSLGMAVGEFVSVSTQRDIEMSMRRVKVEPEGRESHAEGKKEKGGGDGLCLAGDQRQRSTPRTRVFPEGEKGEVTKAGDEKAGEDEDEVLSNPYLAASASALAFLCGAIVPTVSAMVVKEDEMRGVVVAVVASFALALFGGVGAYIGGSSIRASATRVLVGGWVGMGITYGLLKIFDRDDD